jgi:hypothetical protein
LLGRLQTSAAVVAIGKIAAAHGVSLPGVPGIAAHWNFLAMQQMWECF